MLPASFQYLPNIEGAKIFCNQILPEVRKLIPASRLILVGRDSAGEAKTLQKTNEVITTGEVPDTKPYLCKAGAVVVPIFHGSGTRFKILEALALEAPVVSTPLGAEGLDVTDGEHLLIREIDGFAEAILWLLRNPDRARALGKAGRALVERKYSWPAVERTLREALLLSTDNRLDQRP